LLTVRAHANAQTSPLPSWNDGPAKQAIVSFVNKVTDKSGPNYVEPERKAARARWAKATPEQRAKAAAQMSRAYWDSLSAEERSAEMKRRAKKRRKK